MNTEITKYGICYESPQGLEENQYYELMYEFIDLAKLKGLTVRQSQKLFTDCADAVLDAKLNEYYVNENYLKSIASSLQIISEKGIDIFKKNWN